MLHQSLPRHSGPRDPHVHFIGSFVQPLVNCDCMALVIPKPSIVESVSAGPK